MVLRLLVGALLAVLALSGAAFAEPFRSAHVETELHSARAAIAPGEKFTVLLRQKIIPGWHTYWRNPGDSGAATTVTWQTPPGFHTGDLQWPPPVRMRFGPLITYNYSGEVLYPVEITAPRVLNDNAPITLTAHVAWLVCADICIPEQGDISLTLPIAAQGRDDPTWAPRARAALAALPQTVQGESHITAGDPATLSIERAEADARNPYFFAYDQNVTDHVAPQTPQLGARGMSLSLKPGVDPGLGRGPLAGVLTYETASGEKRAFEIHATPGAPLPETSGRTAQTSDVADSAGATTQAPATSSPPVDVISAIALAFLGGLILNIMPCVLPVLSIKALSFADGAHSGQARRHGLIYLAGVLVTFIVLALLLLALRSAGEQIGWGFQLQIPWVSAGLALLFFVIGLNLLGVFEITGLENAGSGLAARGGDLGAFFTGALAVIAATPCTAPFMAGAIGAALTQSAPVVLAVFTALALGFAAPLVTLSFAPGLQHLLPKPGAWMVRAKQVLAFPMFGAAVWLAWVLTAQAGAAGALSLLSIATALAFALVVARWGRVWLVVGVLALAITGGFVWKPLAGVQVVEALKAEPWSEARVTALRAEGRGVFVNFTAAWCVTCHINEAVALERPGVAAAFAAHNIAYLRGDWTNQDAAIASALAAQGRAGVPLYLYYAPGRDSVVLPQVLTEQIVIDALNGR